MINDLHPTTFVIFGITGDLSQRYLLPALYQLFKADLLPEHTRILGLSRQDLTPDELFARVPKLDEDNDTPDQAILDILKSKTELLRFDPSQSNDYEALGARLNQIEDEQGICMNRLYYLSIPPSLFSVTLENIGHHKLDESCQHGNAAVRVLIEKPFGNDVASAEALISETSQFFHEEQVFRIDHYLAKETVQNIVAFRYANPIFNSVWSRDFINKIEIIASEELGVANRAVFYDGVGALRDLVQNHLLQLLAVTTMDLSQTLNGDAIHQDKRALLDAVSPADPAQALRGQYASYHTDVKNDQSMTESFVRLQLQIDNDTWRDVPIEIVTGKRLATKRTEIVITFKSPDDKQANKLIFRIQPNEGIHLDLLVKRPSFSNELDPAALDFNYQNTFGTGSNHPDAYERVLVDAVRGDRTLFATSDEVLASWRIIEPLITAWQGNSDNLITYADGTDILEVDRQR